MTLVHSGPDFFDRIVERIGVAQSEIRFHNYIFAPDSTGERVAAALIDAASRGVVVNILLDSFGSAPLRRSELFQRMRSAGIRVRFFSPYYLSSGFRAGRRLHHKILVIDGIEAFVSGINVSDDYCGTAEKRCWLDYGVYLRGDVCQQLVYICSQLENNRYYGARRKPVTEAMLKEQPMVRFRQSDYLRNLRQISQSYTNAIEDARKEIVIVNAYFLPGTRLRNLVERAAKRGVKIHLILSAQSDVPIVKRAMNWYYDWLIRNDVKVYEYRDANVHAKAAVFDGELAMIGSYNLNFLSEYLSVELNVDVRDEDFVTRFRNELVDVMNTRSTLIDAEALKNRVWSNRLFNYFSYRAMSWSMRVMNFMTRKDRINQLE